MKFTKTWKRFWTMNRHHAAGFTLVELIVVIAILAILAGIAIPAYSGYINKAKEAGDYTLLSAINTAYAAACIENGVAATATKPGIQGYKDANDIVVTGVGDAIAEDFGSYLGDNKGTDFEVINQLYFDGSKGVFNVDGEVTVSYGGQSFTIYQSDIDNLTNSTFGDMGASALLGQLDSTASIIANGLSKEGSTLGTLLTDNDYLGFMLNSFGVDTSEINEADYSATLEKYLLDNGYAESASTIMANGAVLYAAQTSTGMTASSATDFLCDKENSIYDNIQNSLSTDPSKAMSETAVAYGMYLAYAESTGASTNYDVFLTTIKGESDEHSSAFQNYVAGADGQKDLDGYLSALEMISSNTSNPDADVSGLLTGNFNNSELNDLLKDFIGE